MAWPTFTTLLAQLCGRPNPQFYTDAGGVIRPIRRPAWWFFPERPKPEGAPYDEAIVREHKELHERRGITAWEHQQQERLRRVGPVKQLEARRDRLIMQREALREEIAAIPAADLTDLIRKHGKERGEINLIPFEQGRRIIQRYSGYPPEKYRTAIVQRGPHKYLRWEYVLDGVAQAFGYPDSQALKDDVEQAQRLKDRLDDLNREIAAVTAELREARGTRKRRATA